MSRLGPQELGRPAVPARHALDRIPRALRRGVQHGRGQHDVLRAADARDDRALGRAGARPLRFCFKFPRTITHDRCSIDARRRARRVPRARSRRSSTSSARCSSSCRRHSAPAQLAAAARAPRPLPRAFHYAVEVRHEAFFDFARAALDDVLAEHDADVVILDTRGIHSSLASSMPRRAPASRTCR